MIMKKLNLIQHIRRTSFALYAILTVIMAIATLLENSYGTEFAHQHIYEAWWFYVLWGMALMTTLPCIPAHIRGVWRFIRRKRSAAIVVFMLTISTVNASEVRVVEKAQADSMRAVQVRCNNRICPLNTVARDFTLKLTGKTTYQGLTPEQVMLSWAEYPEDWKDVAMIKVKKAEVKEILGITTKDARFSDFFDKQGNYRLTPNQFPDIEDRLILIGMLTKGMLFAHLPQGVQPLSQEKVKAELLYNSVPWDTILFASCFTLAFILFLLRMKKKEERKTIRLSALFVKCFLSLFLLTALIIRWYISDHLPLTSTYETLLIVAFTALCFSCCTKKNDLPALIVAASTLLVAHIGALDPQVTSLMPILQSPWLSSHVTSIMISYCLFALLLFRPNRTMLIWAELLLATGIILGAIWAKTAWGAYWSWDPKETWALISFIVYMYPLHPATLPWFRSEKHQKIYLRLAFLTILMTYFGCNYLLTGMHSYAN